MFKYTVYTTLLICSLLAVKTVYALDIVFETPAFSENTAAESSSLDELATPVPLSAEELGFVEEGETIYPSDPDSIMKLIYFQDGSGHVIDNRSEKSSRAASRYTTYGVSGSLSGFGGTHCYGPYDVYLNQYANANFSWAPTSCDIEISLYNGTYYGVVCTGGSCSIREQVGFSDSFYLCVKNLCGQTVNYSGFYWFDW